LRRTLLSAALACGLAGAARADVRLYEGFDYPANTSIRTQSGGTGWVTTGTNTTWNNTGNATENATSPGMTYGNLVVAGNKVELTAATSATGSGNNAFIRRDAAQTFGTDNTTLWISFLGQRTGTKSGTAGPGGTPTYHRVFGISFFNDTTENFSIGELSADANDTWNLNPTTTVADSQHTTAPIDAASFILAKITYDAANADTAQLWVNPNLALGEAGLGPAAATIPSDDLTFNGVRLSAGGSQSGGILAASGTLDELRVGDTFADVTPATAPVPEPTAMTALALGALALLPRRRHPH
jgi:MYXO-CTERM domain-containing protein